MNKAIPAVFVSLFLAAIPAAAQSSTELLQKGIYAQETEGNLDNAILIYRQIVNSAPTQRDIAAQAQYRLAQALLQKGDLATAAKEFERLSRDYSDYGGLVSSLAGQMRPAPGAGGRGGRGGSDSAQAILDLQAARMKRQARLAELQAKRAELLTKEAPEHPDIRTLEAQIQDLEKASLTAQSQTLFATEFDDTKPVTLTGTVSQVMWINPRAWLKIENTSGGWTFMLAAPNTMVRTGKMTPATLPVGTNVRITGVLAKDGSQTVRADTISSQEQSGEVKLLFDRAWLAPAP
jgi:tetratricopeptide (TPR) repeat protein